MHRLISPGSVYQNRFLSLSIPNPITIRSSAPVEIKCSFCRNILLSRPQIDYAFAARYQSTKTVSAPRSMRKKSKHKNYKKYGELLEIGQKAMTETKISINKLRAEHLSKLTSSAVSLGQLHQLTTKPNKNITVDPELLQTVKQKILGQSSKPVITNQMELEDDKCALVFTTHTISNLEDRFKTKQYLEKVKESYYNFQKATLYDQRLQDLRYAINEGLNQELDFANTSELEDVLPKSPHAVFRELFVENQLDSYDQELISHITSMQSHGIAHPAIEEIYEDSALHNEIAEPGLDIDIEPAVAKGLKIKKASQALKQKKRAKREKRRAQREVNMKHDLKEMERRGKQEALHRLLITHLHLLSSLNMIHEGRRILQYYRQKGAKHPDGYKIKDVKVYNTLLHGYAYVGMFDGVEEILSIMAEDQIEANAQTFAAVFECIERSKLEDKLTLLRKYSQIMQEKGIQLNNLVDKTKFLYNQRELVIQAIRRLDPYFEPQYTPPVLNYECSLLNNLNEPQNRLGLKNCPAEGLLSVEEILKKAQEQIEIEIKGDIEIKNIDSRDELSESVVFCRQKLEETESEWRKVIKEAFIRNLGSLKSQSSASHSAITLYPYLKVLSVDQFVDLIMGEMSKLVDGSETYSPTLKLLQRELGSQVYHKYQLEEYRRNGQLDKLSCVYAQYCGWYLQRGGAGAGAPSNARQAWQTILHRNAEGPSIDVEENPWPMETRQSIGKFLYNIIINDVKIDVNMFKTKAKVKKLPGVYKVHRPWGRLVRLELKPHPAVARLWAGARRPVLRVRAALAPAAAPPAPWHHPAQGAYLLTPTPLIRMPLHVVNQTKRLEQAPPQQLYPVLDSLNQLGEVPWNINPKILDLQLSIFRSGGNKKLDIPPPMSALDTSSFEAANSFKRRVAINRARAEMHSLWCDMLYKLSLANHFRDRTFWLPHNMDFRGRVYACGPHVSALGADSARALLTFARKRPLGPGGLRWLKLHAVNLTGACKQMTLDERLEYADSIMDLILDSADNPLSGAGWWMKAEEPWQTLACCCEIANAVRAPNVEEYMCGFPVHQDGSCNGLQHYAALGGDRAGAGAVNLAPAPAPRDVYTAVASAVEEMRSRDAAAGVQAAIILERFVRRKVIKQTVMTTVYGVTKFGARLQIAKQLKDIDEFPKEHVWTCSQYLTTKTFDSLREMFTSTKLIQDWFTDCAKLISVVCGESVEWETPLGLPVVQPYYRRAAAASPVPAPAAHRAPLDLHQRPCTMKQRNAFPPNFIHSLDASHMMLTSLRCEAAGLTFVSVHDCFWTHPATVDTMNQICREEFVALHSQPILEDLSDFLVKRYSYQESEVTDCSKSAEKRRVNTLLKQVPPKGDFDLKSVLDSVYFFS